MTNSNTNPWSGQYLTHAYSHITRAVAAMDSCFGLVRPHKHGTTVGQNRTKTNCCLFERLFKVKKSSVFLFGISFFVLEISPGVCIMQIREVIDVIGRFIRTVQHSVKNISRNIKVGTRNVHHKRNKITAVMLLP